MEFLEHVIRPVQLWEVVLLVVAVWVIRNPQHMKFIQSIKVGDLEIKLRELELEVSSSKEEIRELEQELESERRLFGDLLEGFDANSPLPELARTRELLKANARNLGDLGELTAFLRPGASPEELYAAAVTIREKRATALFDDVVACLDRLAVPADLGGIRLNTVWTLASALHLMLVASVRDGATPAIGPDSLRTARGVLLRLQQNPRVQADRPDKPERGVRGPVKHALNWIDKALEQ